MVSGKNTLAAHFQAAANAKQSNVSRPSKVQKKGDDFRSMMDKQVQNDTAKPQKPQKTEKGAESSQKNETIASQNEEKTPAENVPVQIISQYAVLPEQERAAFQWGEAPTEAVLPLTAETAVKAVSAEAAVPAGVSQETQQEQPKAAEQMLSDTSVKADVSKKDEVKASVKTENTAKQTNHEKTNEKVETTQTTKETAVHANKKAVKNEDVLEGKEMVWQKETVTEDAVPAKAVPKAKTEETLLKFKVGDAVDLSEAKGTEALAEKILMRSIGKDNNVFEMQLKPQELGSIKIKLVFEHGKVNVAMFCENQKAAELLSANSAKLSEIIENRTGDQTNVHVQQKEENLFRDDGQKENNRQNAQEQKKENHDDKNDGELLDFVQQMRLGLAGVQSII